MTLRFSELQSDSDLDSYSNNCDVYLEQNFNSDITFYHFMNNETKKLFAKYHKQQI